MKKVYLLALLSLLSFSSFADNILLGQPAYGGNGCPTGSASTTLSPDNKSLSILFDAFMVETGGSSGKRANRKSCNIGIPVHVPSGYSVSVFKIDYRGFNNLPAEAVSRFSVEYFFAGTRGRQFLKTFYGPLSNDYLLSNNMMGEAISWSPCGQDVVLRANTGMLVTTNARYEEAMSTLDSMDIKAGIVYHLNWKYC